MTPHRWSADDYVDDDDDLDPEAQALRLSREIDRLKASPWRWGPGNDPDPE